MRGDVLCDGAVAAKLMAGDAVGARRTLESLTPRLRRDREDLRTRLMLAYVEALEQRADANPVMAPAAGR